MGVENRVGRLVEYTSSPVERWDTIRATLQGFIHPHGSIVLVSDLRGGQFLDPQGAEGVLEAFRRHREGVTRNGMLLAQQGGYGLQLERIIRETGVTSRRVFYEIDPLITWLAEVLSPAEKARAQAFLAAPER